MNYLLKKIVVLIDPFFLCSLMAENKLVLSGN